MNSRNDAIRICVRREDFRVSFVRAFMPVAFGALALSELYFIMSCNISPQVLLLVLPMTVGLLCACVIVAMCLKYKFEVGPEGIDCYDFWMRRHRTSWSAMSRTRFISLFGLDYLLVNVRDKRRTIWIPLFVTRYHVLRDMLITYADAEHALHEKLHDAA